MTKTLAPRPPGGRVYLDPKDTVLSEIDQLVEKLGFHGRKELITEAIGLYAIMIDEVIAGRRVGVLEPATRDFIRILTPGLRAAGKQAVTITVTKEELVPA
ncbi:MAG TPA: hypothetical protein DCQ04_16425 [Actinobacteria bacterium]|nr:hypothetical protein [Actinomycetota bacterium]